jgi:GntR family transcriptional regulator
MEKLQSKKGGKALYIQIKDIYRQKILSGELKPGDKIESEMEIQKKYGVSRITARQAILDLEKEGMVNRGRGKGTFVIWKPAIKEHLSTIRSFTHEMQLHGRVPGTSNFTIKREEVDDNIAEIFSLPKENREMYCFRRVRTADDVKLVYVVSYFPLDVEIPLEDDMENPDSYDSLAEFKAGTPTRIEEEFSAEIPDDEVRSSLNIPKTQPVLARKRISYDSNDDIIDYTVCYYRGDLYTYTHSANSSNISL